MKSGGAAGGIRAGEGLGVPEAERFIELGASPEALIGVITDYDTWPDPPGQHRERDGALARRRKRPGSIRGEAGDLHA